MARSISSPSMFAAFPDGIRVRLLSSAVERKFSDGQIVQQRGDKTTGFYIVEHGQLKLGRFGSDGTFQVNLIMGQGDSYGELAVLGEFPRVLDVVALGKTRLLWVSESDLDRVLEERPDVARQFMRVMAQQLQEALNTIVAQRKLTSRQLLARSIAAMCGDNQMPMKLAINHSDLAELLGVSRVTVAKALGRLEAEKLLVREYGSLIINDAAKLRGY